MRISIITPVYNTEKYLCECIDSVLSLSFTDFELLLIDDGSTDSSLDICERYKNLDERVKVFKSSHQGAGVARNIGIEHAQGDYLLFLDSDDMLESGENIAYAYSMARANDLDVVLCNGRITTADGTLTDNRILRVPLFPTNNIFTPKEAGASLFLIAGGPWAKLFHRKYIIDKDIRFPELSRSEDFPFVQLALATAEKIGIHNADLYKWRLGRTDSLESTRDIDPLVFFEAECFYYKELQIRNLQDFIDASKVSTIRRFVYNLDGMKTFDGFSKIFALVKEKYNEFKIELKPDDKMYMLHEENMKYLNKVLSYDTAFDYVYHEYKRLQDFDSKNKSLVKELDCLYNSRSYKAMVVLSKTKGFLRSFFTMKKVKDHDSL